MSTTTHTARPAIVPATHPVQRYFAESGSYGAIQGAALYTSTPTVRVYRCADDDIAEVSVRLGTTFEAAAKLTPHDLRRLASDLLDAAHDIEQHPAAALIAAALHTEVAA